MCFRAAAVLVCALLLGCSENSLEAPAFPSSGQHGGTGGTAAGHLDGSATGGGEAAASDGREQMPDGSILQEASGGLGAGGALDADVDSGVEVDATVPVPAPVAVDACDDQLEGGGYVVVQFPASIGPGFTGDLAEPGLFDVARYDSAFPNPDPSRPEITTTFYVPSGAHGPLPLVIVMHGFATNHRLYDHFADHLASHGFLVEGITLPPAFEAAHDKNADEALAAIDFAIGSNAPPKVLGLADVTRVALAGHSFGGKIAFYAAALDARIKLIIGWDPSNAGGAPCFVVPDRCHDFPVAPNCAVQDAGMLHDMRAEVLVFRAAPDGANPEADHNAIHFFRGAPSPATLIDYDVNATHGDWANPATAVIEHTKRVQLALLLARFNGVTGLEPWLPGGDRLASDSALVRVLSK